MINLPKSWSEIKVETWQELNTIEADNDITKFIKQISILADCDEEDIRSLTLTEFNKLKTELDFLQRPIKSKIQLKIKVGGREYGLIPDFNFLTTGEFLDADNWKDKPIDNLHLYLALIYRPIIWQEGEEYKIAKHQTDGFMQRAELFRKELTIDHIYGATLFFSSLGVSCMRVIADYLTPTETMNSLKTNQIL